MDNKVLDLSSLDKTKITVISGNEEKDIYLNLSDVNIISRFQEKMEDLKAIGTKADGIKFEKDDLESTLKFGVSIKELDIEMKNILDYIFDAPVSEVCMSFGSSFDIINGKARYEQVLDSLLNLYSTTITEETSKLQRIKKHTSKYVKA